jgi:NAD(P)-dependent dehydrogenase (short-subunit alcohol dehydrogenase family)
MLLIAIPTRPAIITGGAQGLVFGRGAPARPARAAANFALLGRSAEKGKAAVAELQKAGAEAIFIAADMADPNACLGAVETALKRFGTINALVNSGASTARGTLVDTTVERYNELFDTNARGPFFLMQAVVRHLLETKQQGFDRQCVVGEHPLRPGFPHRVFRLQGCAGDDDQERRCRLPKRSHPLQCRLARLDGYAWRAFHPEGSAQRT